MAESSLRSDEATTAKPCSGGFRTMGKVKLNYLAACLKLVYNNDMRLLGRVAIIIGSDRDLGQAMALTCKTQ